MGNEYFKVNESSIDLVRDLFDSLFGICIFILLFGFTIWAIKYIFRAAKVILLTIISPFLPEDKPQNNYNETDIDNRANRTACFRPVEEHKTQKISGYLPKTKTKTFADFKKENKIK